MQNENIDALNDVTKSLIDSHRGYKQAYEMSDDSSTLRSQFQTRMNEREALVADFQNHVRALGGEPVTDGGSAGAVHRGFTKFSSMFRDDEQAALSAIDDGEEHLAEEIQRKLNDDRLSPDIRSLLTRAHDSAVKGEAFAERNER
jgi:uncharacterized protein (TIGR02284 family)